VKKSKRKFNKSRTAKNRGPSIAKPKKAFEAEQESRRQVAIIPASAARKLLPGLGG
jgi:hypothetical protein